MEQMDAHPLFSPCPEHCPISPESAHDCAECYRNVHGRACATFQERFVQTLFPGMEPHQVRFLAGLRLFR